MDALMAKKMEEYISRDVVKSLSKSNVCEQCQTELVDTGGYIGCPDCGIVHSIDLIPEPGIKEKLSPQGRYVDKNNKVRYFKDFLYKIQGMGGESECVTSFVRDMRNIYKGTVTVSDIRAFAKRRDYAQNILHYLPDIFYVINNIKPMELPSGAMKSMLNKFVKVVVYEKEKKIKLPFKKKYFARMFIMDLGRPYLQLLMFCDQKKSGNMSDMTKYHKCYKELFQR